MFHSIPSSLSVSDRKIRSNKHVFGWRYWKQLRITITRHFDTIAIYLATDVVETSAYYFERITPREGEITKETIRFSDFSFDGCGWG